MERLNRYNQKILAIIGTTVIVAFSFCLLFGLGALIISLDFSADRGNGLKIRNTFNRADTILTRIQQVTFKTPVQLDTANTDFLIPVGQVNLQSEEKVRLNVGSGLEFSGSGYRFDTYYGLFNNFILFEYETGQRTRIFAEKVALTNWSNVKAGGTELLLFMGTKSDSNKDKLLDSDDYQSLYAFYLKDKKLLEYTMDGKTVLGYEPMKKTDLVAVRLGIDKDKDFKFERNTEPQEIAILNVGSRKIEALVPREMKAEIQDTIDK